MAAVCNMTALWFLPSFFFFLSFPRLISAVGDWMSTILIHNGVALASANLECRSETCCMQLARNAGPKNRHLGTIAQICRAISSQLRHVSTIGNKKASIRWQDSARRQFQAGL